MPRTTVTSREFNQDVGRAKRASKKGPVFITDRGRAAHVLLTIDEYERITANQRSIIELLACPEVAEIDFEPPRLERLYKRPELS